MIELCQYEKKYLAICKHYQAIFDTPKVQETEEEWKEVCCVHVCTCICSQKNYNF